MKTSKKGKKMLKFTKTTAMISAQRENKLEEKLCTPER